MDVLLVPTVLQNFMVAEIEAEEKHGARPAWTKNSLSGRFTNFVNLLDMAAISVPSALLRSEDLADEASRSGTPPPSSFSHPGGMQAGCASCKERGFLLHQATFLATMDCGRHPIPHPPPPNTHPSLFAFMPSFMQ